MCTILKKHIVLFRKHKNILALPKNKYGGLRIFLHKTISISRLDSGVAYCVHKSTFYISKR